MFDLHFILRELSLGGEHLACLYVQSGKWSTSESKTGDLLTDLQTTFSGKISGVQILSTFVYYFMFVAYVGSHEMTCSFQGTEDKPAEPPAGSSVDLRALGDTLRRLRSPGFSTVPVRWHHGGTQAKAKV